MYLWKNLRNSFNNLSIFRHLTIVFYKCYDFFYCLSLNYSFKHVSKNLYEIRLRTPLRTFEAENAKKIRTSRLGRKNGVLIEKKSVRDCLQSFKSSEWAFTEVNMECLWHRESPLAEFGCCFVAQRISSLHDRLSMPQR